METHRAPITSPSTWTTSAILLVLCTLAYFGAVAVGVRLALSAIQSLLSLPCAVPYLPCA